MMPAGCDLFDPKQQGDVIEFDEFAFDRTVDPSVARIRGANAPRRSLPPACRSPAPVVSQSDGGPSASSRSSG
jgi:hypothetical protein